MTRPFRMSLFAALLALTSPKIADGGGYPA